MTRMSRAFIGIAGAVLITAMVSANLSGPPIGHTGAPGEGTCADTGCHDLPSNREGLFKLSSMSSYAEDTLLLNLTLVDAAVGTAVDVYGFQLTVSDSLHQPFGELLLVDSARTQLVADSTGRQYLMHTDSGTVEHTCSNCLDWNFKWVRPAGYIPGDVIRFNLSGILADGDGTPLGDASVTDTLDQPACPVTITGDANQSGSITSADVIAFIGTLFKGGQRISPCLAAGDVNCDGRFTAGDAVYLINMVFKGGPPPCDVCPLIFDATWDCF